MPVAVESEAAIRPSFRSQAAWSVASSGSALMYGLVPTTGLALVTNNNQLVGAVIRLTWLATLVSVISSLGTTTLAAPAGARAIAENDLEGVARVARLVAAHVLCAAALALPVGFTPIADFASVQMVAAFVIASASTAAQASGNAMLGGILKNETIFFLNAAGAFAVAIALVIGNPKTPASAMLWVSLGMLARTGLFLGALFRIAPWAASGNMWNRAEAIWPYAISLVSLFSLQRLEVGFLQHRGSAGDVRAFGVAYDLSQIVRGIASSSFGVLIPFFAVKARSSLEAVWESAERIAVATAVVCGLGSATGTLLLRALNLDHRLLGTTDLMSANLVFLSAGLGACGTAYLYVLMSQGRFGGALVALGISGVSSLVLNQVFTSDLRSGSLVTFGTGVVFASAVRTTSRRALHTRSSPLALAIPLVFAVCASAGWSSVLNNAWTSLPIVGCGWLLVLVLASRVVRKEYLRKDTPC